MLVKVGDYVFESKGSLRWNFSETMACSVAFKKRRERDEKRIRRLKGWEGLSRGGWTILKKRWESLEGGGCMKLNRPQRKGFFPFGISSARSGAQRCPQAVSPSWQVCCLSEDPALFLDTQEERIVGKTANLCRSWSDQWRGWGGVMGVKAWVSHK